MELAKDFAKSCGGRKSRATKGKKRTAQAVVIVDVPADAVKKPAEEAGSPPIQKKKELTPPAEKVTEAPPTTDEQPAKKQKVGATTTTSSEAYQRPLETPRDDLEDVSLQPSQSLGGNFWPATSSVVGRVSPVQPAGAVQSKTAPADGSSSFKTVEDAPFRYKMVAPRISCNELVPSAPSLAVKVSMLAHQELITLGSLARSYEIELEAAKASSLQPRVDELTTQLMAAKAENAKLEKTNVNLSGWIQREETNLKRLREEKKAWLAKEETMNKKTAATEAELVSCQTELIFLKDEVAKRESVLDELRTKWVNAQKQLRSKVADAEKKLENKVLELEKFKADMKPILKDQWSDGFAACDKETKEIIDQIDPNFDWDKFDLLVAEKEKKEKAEEAAREAAKKQAGTSKDPSTEK